MTPERRSPDRGAQRSRRRPNRSRAPPIHELDGDDQSVTRCARCAGRRSRCWWDRSGRSGSRRATRRRAAPPRRFHRLHRSRAAGRRRELLAALSTATTVAGGADTRAEIRSMALGAVPPRAGAEHRGARARAAAHEPPGSTQPLATAGTGRRGHHCWTGRTRTGSDRTGGRLTASRRRSGPAQSQRIRYACPSCLNCFRTASASPEPKIGE